MKSKSRDTKYYIFATIITLVILFSGFVFWRWYMISHPYSYLDFTTYKPTSVEVKDVTLTLQGYKQEIFHGVFSDSYLPKKISLEYTIAKNNLRVSQTKSTWRAFTEEECNKQANTEKCKLITAPNDITYIALYSDTDNAVTTPEAILLAKDSTLIRVSPLDDSRIISREEWNSLISNVLTPLEPHSFEGSAYRFFDSWDI